MQQNKKGPLDLGFGNVPETREGQVVMSTFIPGDRVFFSPRDKTTYQLGLVTDVEIKTAKIYGPIAVTQRLKITSNGKRYRQDAFDCLFANRVAADLLVNRYTLGDFTVVENRLVMDKDSFAAVKKDLVFTYMSREFILFDILEPMTQGHIHLFHLPSSNKETESKCRQWRLQYWGTPGAPFSACCSDVDYSIVFMSEDSPPVQAMALLAKKYPKMKSKWSYSMIGTVNLCEDCLIENGAVRTATDEQMTGNPA